MIVCEECGTRNEAGARFCGGCGAYLAFQEDAADKPEESVATAGADLSTPGTVDSVAEEAQRAAERAERERLEAEQAAHEARLAAERAAERERAEAERAEAERAAEQQRREREEAEREQADREQQQRAREAAERAEAEQAQRERAEAERRAAERAEAQRLEQEHRQAEEAERERLEAERQEQAERAERERREREQAERERREAEEAERERLEAARREQERLETQRREAERLEAERAEAERAAEAERVAEARRAAEARAAAEEQRAAAARQAAEAKRRAAAAMLRPVQRPSQRPDAEAAAGAATTSDDITVSGDEATVPGDESTTSSQPSSARQPQARLPGQRVVRPATPPPLEEDEEPLTPGDLICGQCGAGNAPTRKFCRRCGAPLEEAAVVAPLPWYRRIFSRKPREPKAAGTRPVRTSRPTGRAARVARRLLVLAVVLGAIGGLAWVFRDPLQSALASVLDRVGEPAPVTTSAARASSFREPHPVELTIDGFGNTYWLSGVPGEAIGEFIEYDFDEPFRLVAVQMIPGAEDDDQAVFLGQGRPAEVRVTVTTADGETVDRTWRLRDEPGDQEIFIGVDDTRTVRLVIAGANLPAPEASVAVAEVAFFTRG